MKGVRAAADTIRITREDRLSQCGFTIGRRQPRFVDLIQPFKLAGQCMHAVREIVPSVEDGRQI